MSKIDVYLVQKAINVLHKYIQARQKNEPSAWDALYANSDKYEHQLPGGLKINLFKKSVLSKLIFEGFEENEMLFLQHFIKPDDIFLDVGANIGLHSLLAANVLKEKGKVYAFEPTPQTVERLHENVALNNLTTQIKIQPIGLSDHSGELYLNLADNGYDAWNSFVNLKHVPINGQIRVPVSTLDDFISSNNIDLTRVSLIKLDVEGWEIKVLDGMHKTLGTESFSGAFLVEFTEENMFRAGYSCKQLYNYLTDCGYSWYEYDAEKNELKASELKAYYPYENLIATKTPELVDRRLKQGKIHGS